MADTITVNYFAGFVEHTGTSRETLDVPQRTIGALRAAVAAKHGAVAGDLAKSAVVLYDDELFKDDDVVIGANVDLLPPFAGG